MQKEYIVGVAGLLLGIIVTLAAQNFTPEKNRKDYVAGSDKMHDQMTHGDSMSSSMDMMTNSLKGKTGDEFDKAFLAEMIVHHEGAVEMANLALKQANHQEIKDLSNAIISAQNTEISQMKQWQTTWYNN